MANPENSEDIEFRKLGLRGFEQFHRMIERGTIICPKQNIWSKFYTSLGMKEYTWQKEIFDYFENLDGRQSELVVVWKNASVNLVVSNLVQRFRTSGTETISWFIAEGELVQFDENFNRLERSQMRHRMLHKLYQSQTAKVLIERCENFPELHLDGNYCQFGGCSGIGDNVRPTADVRLKSDIYDYVEKAFVMPYPQIEFELSFTQAIQREEMSLTFDKPPEPEASGLSNHFTLDTNAVGGTGLWYADCKLVTIQNVNR